MMKGRTMLMLLVALLLAASLSQGGEGQEELSRYGGRKGPRRAATGYFRTTKAEGRWWLVDPGGYLFISVGVNDVALGPRESEEGNPYREAALARHRNQSEWAKVSVERLRGWGFNTLGAGADRETWKHGMPYTINLDCARAVPWEEGHTLPDVFDPAYERAVRRQVARTCRPLAEDHGLLGYFTDDGLQWQPSEEAPYTLLAQFLGQADDSPGRRALLRFLEERYLNIGELNEAWETEYSLFEEIGRTPQVGSHIPEEDEEGFVRLVAREYFRIAYDAIRAVDKYHLILGCRFQGEAPRTALEAMGGYVNIVSFDDDGALPPVRQLRDIHRITGWPVLIADFGLPRGSAAAEEESQGEQYERYVRAALDLPMVVGYHWSGYVESGARSGRSGRATWGLVTEGDEPRADFAEAVTRWNKEVYRIASTAGKS